MFMYSAALILSLITTQPDVSRFVDTRDDKAIVIMVASETSEEKSAPYGAGWG